MPLVRSYRTLAPLPVPRRAIGGVFLWHCPHGYPHWALPSKPGHWGARTFLNRIPVVLGRKLSWVGAGRDHLTCFLIKPKGRGPSEPESPLPLGLACLACA